MTTNSLTRSQFNTIVCFFGLLYLLFNSYYIAKPSDSLATAFRVRADVLLICSCCCC